MEEEAARQAAANPAPAPPPATGAAAPATRGSDGAPAQVSQPAPAADDDEEVLQQALLLSQGEEGPGADVDMDGGEEELTEEEMIARAIEMSMNPETEEKKK